MQEISESNHQGESGFSLSSNTLKYIAIIAMTIDHIAVGFVPYDSVLGLIMHIVGRITGPIMFYAAVEGYHHTRNLTKYLTRLAAFAIISWFPFLYCMSGGTIGSITEITYVFQPNVIYTILLGVLAIHVRRRFKNVVLKIVIILALIIFCIPADWGTWGIVIIIVFDYFYGSFKNQAFGYCMVVMLDMGMLSMLTHPFFSLYYEGTFDLSGFQINYGIENIGMFIPILLLYYYNGQKGKGGTLSKWFFYIFYPLHLLVLGLLQAVL